ncbi:MAG: 23S rRNA (pseudouridine(1915)-N(3))-methyltransferase RlmH, partial [Candidatus Delongbacteria bacterium]|nr:23S rRNA (pseudouridine(1915)-N(3))-methyltransferase RlmH [Candidatus Delongbacteria bacterium]
MKILFLGIGKTKHKYLTEGIERYRKLISPYAAVEEIYLKEEDDKPDPVNSESEKLEKNIPKNYYSVLLDVEGKMMSSEDLSKIIKSKRDSSVPGIVFLIGG